MNIQSLSGAMPQTLAQPTYHPQTVKSQVAGAQASPKELRSEQSSEQTTPNEVIQETIKDAADRIAEFVNSFNDRIEFSLDNETGQSILKVIDSQTKEVLRQIPSEEALAISKALDKLQGILIQNKA